MSDAPRPDRPPQVTVGGGFAILASALLVATAFDAMSRLRSVDTRADLVKALDSAAGRGLGVTVEQATGVLHGLLLVSGAGAAVATVMAVFALLGHTAARTTLTVLAAVVLVCSLAADVHSAFLVPFLGALLAFAVGLLWTPPARAWFRGEVHVPADASGRPADRQADGTVVSGSEPPEGAQPPPTYGFGGPSGSPPPPGGWYPPPYGGSAPPAQHTVPYPSQHQFPGHPGPARPAPVPRPGVPGTVRTAAILTWVFAGVTLAGFAAAAIALLAVRNDFLDKLEEQQEYQDLDITRNELIALLCVVIAVFALWAIASCVLAFLVWRGHGWARIVLAISAGLTALFCLASLPVSLAHLVAAAVVVGLLFSPTANQWFRARAGSGRAGPPPPPPPYGGTPGPPPGSTYPGPPPSGPGSSEDKPPLW